MSKITVQSIVTSLADHCVEISLSLAFALGRDIMYQIEEALAESYNTGFDDGKKNVDYIAQDKSYNRGFLEGKDEGIRQANAENKHEILRLRTIEQKMIEFIEPMALDIVRRVGTKRKIQCIREVRDLSGLGLRDSKNLVEKVSKIIDEENAYIEKMSREGFTETE